jgi:hypothetical protein
MPDPIEAAAESKIAITPPAEEKPKVRETREEAAGKAVNAARSLFSRMNNAPEEKKEDEKPVETKAEKKAEAPKAEKKEQPPEEEKVVKRKAKKETKEDLVDALAEAQKPLVEAIRKQSEKAAPEKPEAAKPQLSKSDEKMFARLKKLEEINPNYKEASKAFLDFKEKERAYQAEWEKRNPDSEFEPDDDSHSRFYEKNEPQVDEEDFEEAKEALIREQAEKSVEERVRKELEPVRRKQQEDTAKASAAPKIEKTLVEIGRNAAAAIDPEFAKLKDLSKLADEDPIAAEILTESANRWFPLAQGASLLYSGHPADASNPVFQAVGELVSSLEEQISSMDADDQVRDGKRFATISAYSKMDDRQRARHWYIGENEVVEFVNKRMAYEAKETYAAEVKRADALAKRRGYVQNTAPKSSQSSTPKQEDKPPQQPYEQRSVRVGGSGAPPPAPSAGESEALKGKGGFAKKFGW